MVLIRGFMVVWDILVKNLYFLKNYVCYYYVIDKEICCVLVLEFFDKNKLRYF